MSAARLSPEQRRNFWLTVANGSFVMMGFAFIAFDSIMAGLAYELTESTTLVGLLTTAAGIGWLWPQLLVGSRIEHLERKMPVYRVTVLARVLILGAMLAALLLLPGRPHALYWTVLFCTAAMSSAGGVCSIPFMDIVAKAVPPDFRAMVFAWRRLLGGMLGCAAGLIASYVLAETSPLAYPYNYAALVFCSIVVSSLAYGAFLRIREPIEPVKEAARPFTEFLRGGLALFRKDRDFLLLYAFRVFHSMGTMSVVLVVPFVMDTFGAKLMQTGFFAAVMALASGLSSMAWGRISKAFGEVWAFRIATALLLLTPGSAWLMAILANLEATRAWMGANYFWVCLVLLGVYTAARCGTDIANMVYLMSMSNSEQRPIYMAVMNTLSAPLVTFPALAGLLVSTTSYATAFGVSCGGLLAALVIAALLRHRRV